jgi:phage replication initiation protein
MTKPNNPELDGSVVKSRLIAERKAHRTPVHIDWVRFTCNLRNAPTPEVDALLPFCTSIWDENYRKAEMQKVLRDIPDADWVPSAQALELADEICIALGSDFKVHPEQRKGHDFYKFRWSIERNGAECGWVGYLSSSDSPRQSAQAETLHANLHGAACTFAAHGWNKRIADIVESHHAKLTRIDLALDFFEGLEGGIDQIKAEYDRGLCDSGGKRLRCNMVGDWSANPQDGRSLYFGSKEAGKQTNTYEKGHQLFGFKAGSQWLRIELRFGNKLRVLPVDMLRKPSAYFAGASEWHRSVLLKTGNKPRPEKIKTKSRLAIETVQAEVSRNIRWALNTAAPTLAVAFQHLSEDDFLELVTNKPLPGRLQKFSTSELGTAFARAFTRGDGASQSAAK